jgi:RNA polymerase sigma-B factor
MTQGEDPQLRSASERETLALFRAFRDSRDSTSRDQIVCAHLHLVHSVARRFSGLGESFDDLIQEGTIGLLNAVDLFDPDRGIKFSTYACHLITGQIQHYLRDRGRLIRQPAWVQELNTKISRTTEQLAQQLGRDPQPDEIASKLGIPEESIHNVLAARELNRVMPLQAPSEGMRDGDTLTVEKQQRRASMASLRLPVEDRIVLDETINTLKPLEQQVIRLFFFGDLTQSEIARKLGISVNYASYLLRRGITKIKTALDEQSRQEAAALTEREDVPVQTARDDVPIHDPITGAYSGAYLRTRVAEEVARSRRYPTNFALILAEVHGLPTDAEVQKILIGTAQFIKNCTRTIDMIAYLGNFRFALLLPHTGREARVLGERLCQRYSVRDADIVPFLCVGYAVFPMDGSTMERLFDRAEHALTSSVKSGSVCGVPAGRPR